MKVQDIIYDFKDHEDICKRSATTSQKFAIPHIYEIIE